MKCSPLIWWGSPGISLANIREALAFQSEPVTELDASHWQDVNLLMSDLAKGFGFPSYFGRNWDATLDCLRDALESGRLIIIRGVTENCFSQIAKVVASVDSARGADDTAHRRVAVVLVGKKPRILEAFGRSYGVEMLPGRK